MSEEKVTPLPQTEETAVTEDEAVTPEAPHPLLVKLQAFTQKVEAHLDSINERLAPVEEGSEPTPTSMARGPILMGAWCVIIVFGFIGLWSAVAPLASAAIAPGKVILSGNKKTIQHLEGGIVDEILVREGQAVSAGQPLIKLNETAARARLELFRKQYLSARAAEARLIAEQKEKSTINFPKEIEAEKKDADIKELLDSQERLLKSRRDAIEGQKQLLTQRKSQYVEEISGLESQVTSATEQIDFLNEEIRAVRTLLKQGNAQKPRLLALQRQRSQLKGQRGEYKAQIARAQQAMNETDLEIINISNDFQNKIAAEMKETVEKIGDLQERLKASVDVMERIIISAPLAGVITDLRAHTMGGVIRPGDKIMDIVPIDELLVESSVSPQDIDVVVPGLDARVRLSAYKARSVPPLAAEVVHVSPDRFENQQTGESFYLARMKIKEAELKEHGDLELLPGMPAEALIITGERTVLAYLMGPITESFRNAFREE